LLPVELVKKLVVFNYDFFLELDVMRYGLLFQFLIVIHFVSRCCCNHGL